MGNAIKPIYCHSDWSSLPIAPVQRSVDLECTAKAVWNSMSAGYQSMLEDLKFSTGMYYPTYVKTWEYTDGQRVVTTHLAGGQVTY